MTVDVGAPIISIDTGGRHPGRRARPRRRRRGDRGAKIGEMTADGRIATLVGLVRPIAAASRRPRRPARRTERPRAAAPDPVGGRPVAPPPPPAPVRLQRNGVETPVPNAAVRRRSPRHRSASWQGTGGRSRVDPSRGTGRRDHPAGRRERRPRRDDASPRRPLRHRLLPARRRSGRPDSVAGAPGSDQGCPQGDGGGHGRQRLHRAACAGIPDRRRHRDDGAAASGCGRPSGVRRREDDAADVRGPGGAQAIPRTPDDQRVLGRDRPQRDRLQALRQSRHRRGHRPRDWSSPTSRAPTGWRCTSWRRARPR